MTGLRRDLGTVESYATIIGILIGAGIFKVTSEAWALTGPGVILGYLVLAPAIVATSVAYSVFISTPLGREPGGEYAHISRTFGGHGLAFVGVWLKIISYIGALAYLARAFADYLLGGRRPALVMPIAVAILLFFYVIHVIGVRWFGRVQVWMCLLLGVSLVVLIVPGLFAIHPENYHPFITHGFRGFAASLPPLFFAYAGFESLAQTAGEVRDSTRRLPRIFLLGVTATTIIYLLMSIVAFGVLPGQQLAASAAPMTTVAMQYLPRGAEVLITIGALMAITTSLNGTMLVPSRVAIVLVEDGLAPRWLARISPRTGTPVIGLTITTAAALILLLSGQVGARAQHRGLRAGGSVLPAQLRAADVAEDESRAVRVGDGADSARRAADRSDYLDACDGRDHRAGITFDRRAGVSVGRRRRSDLRCSAPPGFPQDRKRRGVEARLRSVFSTQCTWRFGR